jgi:hypothetical protein
LRSTDSRGAAVPTFLTRSSQTITNVRRGSRFPAAVGFPVR